MKHQVYFSKLILFCIGMIPLMVNAQVTINVQLPPGGLIQKDQLWNLTIVNNKEDTLNVNIKLTLQDAMTGQVVMTGNTESLVLGKGVKIISNEDIQPILYNYNSAELSHNFLPMGTYIACYQIYQIKGETIELLTNECINLIIEPLSPPLLSTPEDKREITTSYPLFTWMPPTPIDMFSDLNYDIVIAEVLAGQSAMEAIEYNTPIYTSYNLTQPIENYPSSFAKLESGKTYAWQVIAKNNFSYAAKTSVWTFTIGKEIEPIITPVNKSYLLLENDLKDTYIITNKQIHIKYASFDAAHDASIIFSGLDKNNVYTINKKVVQGDNYFDIDLNNNFQNDITYSVTITDLAGKSQILLFSIKQ